MYRMSNTVHLISYYIGIFIVFFTHIYMLISPSMTTKQVRLHAGLNIFAALCIAYYFTNREGYIKF